MAKAASSVSVLYPPGPTGQEWMVPSDVFASGEAARWIEQQRKLDARHQAEQERVADEALLSEFRSMESKLGQVEQLQGTIANLQQTVASYEAADEARQSELQALRSSQDSIAGIGTEAGQTLAGLHSASTSAAFLLDELRRTASTLETQIATAFNAADQRIEALEKQLADARNSAVTRQRLEQELVGKLEDQVAALEAKVIQATQAADEALMNAEKAQRANTSAGNIQDAADLAAKQAMADWETSSDTATMRRLIGTDHRNLQHLRLALESLDSTEIGGVSVQVAQETAQRLIERIALAQDFVEGPGAVAQSAPDMPDGFGNAAPPRGKKRGRKS